MFQKIASALDYLVGFLITPRELLNLQKINRLWEEYNKIVAYDVKTGSVWIYNKKKRRIIFESITSVKTKEHKDKIDLFCKYYEAWEDQRKS